MNERRTRNVKKNKRFSSKWHRMKKVIKGYKKGIEGVMAIFRNLTFIYTYNIYIFFRKSCLIK